MTNDSDKAFAALDSLTNLAYQFGPFFFALLFTLFITRTARNWYSAQRGDSAAALEEKRTFKRYFQLSQYFGMFLVLVAVGWWFVSSWDQRHAFEGIVVSLNSKQKLDAFASDESFLYRMVPHSEGIGLSDYRFVIVSSHPFHKGDKIWLNYWDLSQPGGTGAPPGPSVIGLPVTEKYPQHYRLVTRNGTVAAEPLQ